MKGFFKRAVCVAMAAGAMTTGLILAGPTSSGASTPTTATWAEPPQATPNFILPFYPAQLCSVDNIEQFQFLMYRPLYWFGDNGQVQLNPSLSLADAPVYSSDGKSVITPNADILIYDGDLVRDWQIYIDVAPVYA